MPRKLCAERLAAIADQINEDEINALHEQLMQTLNAEQRARFRQYDDAMIERINAVQDATASAVARSRTLCTPA